MSPKPAASNAQDSDRAWTQKTPAEARLTAKHQERKEVKEGEKEKETGICACRTHPPLRHRSKKEESSPVNPIARQQLKIGGAHYHYAPVPIQFRRDRWEVRRERRGDTNNHEHGRFGR